MKVAALQTALTDDVGANVRTITALVREAAGRGANVILPSELFEGAYFCQTQREDDFARARPAKDHPTLLHFQKLAAELGVVIPVSFFEQAGPEYYNSIVVFDADGRDLGLYRKSHIPDGPGYQEKFFFKPGNTGPKTFATKFGTIGVAICWDQWFPELARAMTLAGADVLFYPTAIGSEPEEPDFDSRDAWQRVMIGHAVANSVGVVASNRIGAEGGMTFYGSSFICDPRGDKVAELGRDQPGIAIADLDLAQIQRVRASMGFFRDRRPDLYKTLID
ncbi:MAG TPA: N-carbamoylputrescine amidase [Casimicrobiaceae bacterium]